MRILICAVQIPFVTGGAENHIESLRRELAARDHQVDVVRLPLKWYPPRQILNDALAWRMLDLTHSYGLPVDLVIGTRFPSYAVRHPRKIAWVLHQHRQAYDLLGTPYSDFRAEVDDDEARSLLYELDRRSLTECQLRFANSRNVADRMKRFLDVESEPLYHPPPLAGRYRSGPMGDHLLSVGRLEGNKRVDLFLRALARTRHPIPAWIAGRGPQGKMLEELARELGLADRVRFLGFVSDDELLDLYSGCGAVVYAPLDEDYGYITLEAHLSGKSVITATDSGGVLEFVRDGETGFVAEPEPEALAAAMDRWFESPDRGRSLGKAGAEAIREITWDRVVEWLTAPLRPGPTEP